jgi:hypothetical protein
VIGVIGGYEQGGYTPAVSYSTQFTSNVSALYATAAARASTARYGAALPGQLPYASL